VGPYYRREKRSSRHRLGHLARGSPYVAADNRPQGWAARDYLNNTLGLAGEQAAVEYSKTKNCSMANSFDRSASVSRTLSCSARWRRHYDFAWIEMQHSTLSWADVAKLIAACPQAGATPMIRLADEFESTLQHATDVGAIGHDRADGGHG